MKPRNARSSSCGRHPSLALLAALVLDCATLRARADHVGMGCDRAGDARYATPCIALDDLDALLRPLGISGRHPAFHDWGMVGFGWALSHMAQVASGDPNTPAFRCRGQVVSRRLDGRASAVRWLSGA